MDWVGIIIERTSGLVLEEYFQRKIFQPLGIRSISFYPSDEAKSNLACLHQRLPCGKLVQRDHLYRKPLLAKSGGQDNPVFCAGGHGAFGKPAEFSS